MSVAESPQTRPPSKPGWIVFIAGVTTSALVLWLVAGTSIMGWYLYYIIPIGALIVGVLSGLGYAIAARSVNMTLSPAFVTGMVSVALVDYFAALYITYDNLLATTGADATRYSFVQFLRDSCELISFSGGDGSSPGNPIGLWGYFFKSLEVIGYVAGATLPAKMAVTSVSGTPDCPRCKQYFINYRCAYLNAPENWEDMAEMTHVDRCVAIKQSVTPVIQRAEDFLAGMQGQKLPEVAEAMKEFESEALMGNTGTVSFTLRKCPGCDAFHLQATFAGYDPHGEFSSEKIGSVQSEADSAPHENTPPTASTP